jgi:triosephosphate isomerase
MRQKIVAGNWKMHNDKKATNKLIKGIKKSIKRVSLKNTRVIVAPTFVNLSSALKKAKKSNLEVVAQNMHQAKSGAFTGEISAEMLQSIGIKTVILGHSERRTHFGETDTILAEKVNAVIENGLETIFLFWRIVGRQKIRKSFFSCRESIKKWIVSFGSFRF